MIVAWFALFHVDKLNPGLACLCATSFHKYLKIQCRIIFPPCVQVCAKRVPYLVPRCMRLQPRTGWWWRWHRRLCSSSQCRCWWSARSLGADLSPCPSGTSRWSVDPRCHTCEMGDCRLVHTCATCVLKIERTPNSHKKQFGKGVGVFGCRYKS